MRKRRRKREKKEEEAELYYNSVNGKIPSKLS